MKRDGKAGRRENKAGKNTRKHLVIRSSKDTGLAFTNEGRGRRIWMGGGWWGGKQSDFIRKFHLVRLASSL